VKLTSVVGVLLFFGRGTGVDVHSAEDLRSRTQTLSQKQSRFAAQDLERRRRAFELVAAISGGVMGRTPDYLNVTFACFAGRSDVWARRGNEQGAANLVAYQARMRDRDLSTTHALMNPQVDRSKPEAEQAAGQVALHKVGETDDAIVVRGARMLATLAPFADELLVYPGSDIRPQDGRYALSFAIPIATPNLRFICRDSYSKQRDAFDYPLSSRFDEMDAVVIFDDVEIPKERVFLDSDTVGYSEVTTDTGGRGHIMHQAFTRAYVKLCFALGLGHLIANSTGVVRFDHIQEKLGELVGYVEMMRACIRAAEKGVGVVPGPVRRQQGRGLVHGIGCNAAKLEQIAKENGVARWTTDLRGALANPEDTLYFDAQLTTLRAPSVEAAIAAGKHVYCEKPLGITPEQVDLVLKAARKSTTFLQIGQQLRYYPAIREAMRQIHQQKLLGRVLVVKAQRHSMPMTPEAEQKSLETAQHSRRQPR